MFQVFQFAPGVLAIALDDVKNAHGIPFEESPEGTSMIKPELQAREVVMDSFRPTFREMAIGLGLLRPLRRAEENDAVRKRDGAVHGKSVTHANRCPPKTRHE